MNSGSIQHTHIKESLTDVYMATTERVYFFVSCSNPGKAYIGIKNNNYGCHTLREAHKVPVIKYHNRENFSQTRRDVNSVIVAL